MTITDLSKRPGRHSNSDADTTTPGVLRLDAGPLSAELAAPKEKKKSDPVELYDDETREDLLDVARSGATLAAVRARRRLDNDARRRAQRADAASRPVQFAVPQLIRTDRGYDGPGGGMVAHVRRPNEFRGTTAQVPGLYPFAVGASAPLDGATVGTHQETGQPVGFSHLDWFERGHITAPSTFVFGLNGFGKSSLNRRIVTHNLATGIRPMIMGDHRPDFVNLMRQMVVRDAHGRPVFDESTGKELRTQITSVGFDSPMNPLAVGAFGQIISRLPEKHRIVAERAMRARQVTAAVGLLEICSGTKIAPHERTLLTTALRVLYATSNEFTLTHAPLPSDVLRLLHEAPHTLMAAVNSAADHDPALRVAQQMCDASGALGHAPYDVHSVDRYLLLTENLRQLLNQLVTGEFGEIFNAQTADPIDVDAIGTCVDMSHLPREARALRAAVLLACWSDGFSAVEASHLLTDHDQQEPRNYDLICDEFSIILGVGNGIVQRVDEVTRVQREQGTGTLFTTHTVKDLQAFDSQEERQRAMGFLDRARAKICFPLPEDEAELMKGKINLNDQERSTLAEWATTPRGVDDPVVEEFTEAQWAHATDNGASPHAAAVHDTPLGLGKFLIKTGEGDLPGIPVQMHLTASERSREIHNTNQRFARGRSTATAGAA